MLTEGVTEYRIGFKGVKSLFEKRASAVNSV